MQSASFTFIACVPLVSSEIMDFIISPSHLYHNMAGIENKIEVHSLSLTRILILSW